MITDKDPLAARIDEYLKRSEILRQIHSDKAFAYKRRHEIHTIGTIVVAAGLIFLGFTGIPRFHQLLSLFGSAPPLGVFEFVFSVLVFLLLLLIILGLVFRFQDKAATHNRSIVVLTDFIRDLDDLRALPLDPAHPRQMLDRIRERYQMITQNLPPSTDKEFFRAKRRYFKKQERSDLIKAQRGRKVWFRFPREQMKDPAQAAAETELTELVTKDDWRMEVLRAVRSISKPECWVSGGFVRNKVWDTLHNYSLSTPLDDVDVVYFNSSDASDAADTKLEEQLRRLLPNIPWSVKNQARMHALTGDPAYTSLQDALEKWPETATAVAVKLEPDDSVSFLAPHGFDDLFHLKVRPTAHFRKHPARYEERLKGKNWSEAWPKLSIEHLKIPARPAHPFEQVLPAVFKRAPGESR